MAPVSGGHAFPGEIWQSERVSNGWKVVGFNTNLSGDAFTLYVEDQEVYAKEIADSLESDLQPLATSGLITRISKYDTNPENNPQPPQRDTDQG